MKHRKKIFKQHPKGIIFKKTQIHIFCWNKEELFLYKSVFELSPWVLPTISEPKYTVSYFVSLDIKKRNKYKLE